MLEHTVQFDSALRQWRVSFVAADHALWAARYDLPADELRSLTGRLSQQRSDVVRTLAALVTDRGDKPSLLRLVTSHKSTRSLLGLPADAVACVFNVDGVLVPSAAIHADAWRDAFNTFIAHRVERTGGSFAPFSRRLDYWHLIHGKSRHDAVRDFLASRGISLPEGSQDDPPEAETVCGLANRKNVALHRRIEHHRVRAYEGARLYLELARDADVRCAVVSGSTNAWLLLERAGLTPWLEACVDGTVAAAEGLRRKPAPDMLLAACGRLGAEPAHAVVFETLADGIRAGRAGHFEQVVGVDHEGRSRALVQEGADVVVADLGELLERQLTS